MKRLEVLRIVNEAYQFVWLQRQDFALLGAPIALVLGTASALLSYFRPVANADVPTISIGFILSGVVVAVLSFAGWVVFAVAWHRRCLLPNHGSVVGQELRWQRRHSVFLGRTMVLGLLTIGLSMVLALPIRFVISATGGAGGVITAALWMAMIFIVEARFMLVFPASAVDDSMGFGQSWTRSQGNAFRIAVILILTSVPISIAFAPIDWLVSTALQSQGLLHSLAALFIGSLVQTMLGLVVMACGVTGLSFCLRDMGE